MPLLGYWNIRGLAEPARLMMDYCGMNYEDKRYDDSNDWLSEKFNLGLDFPNLPYFIDGDLKLTESTAILKHIARMHSTLLPITEEEKDKCDMLEGVVTGVRNEYAKMCYMPDFVVNKNNFFDAYLPAKLDLIDDYLDKNKWLGGDRLTYVDFMCTELLDAIELMEPRAFDKFENILVYLHSFFQIEKISAYRQSSLFRKYPVNGKVAHWGGKGEEVKEEDIKG